METNWTLALSYVVNKTLSLCNYFPVDDRSSLTNTFDHDLLGVVKFVRDDLIENPYQFISQNNLLRILVPKNLKSTSSLLPHFSLSVGLSPGNEIDVANFRKNFQRASFVNITVRGDGRKLRLFTGNSLNDPYEYVLDKSVQDMSLADTCSGANIPHVVSWDDICKKVIDFLDFYNAYTMEHHFATLSVISVQPARSTWTVHVQQEVFPELESNAIRALVFAKIGGLNLACVGDLLEIHSREKDNYVLETEIVNITVVIDIRELVTSKLYSALSIYQHIPEEGELIIFELNTSRYLNLGWIA